MTRLIGDDGAVLLGKDTLVACFPNAAGAVLGIPHRLVRSPARNVYGS